MRISASPLLCLLLLSPLPLAMAVPSYVILPGEPDNQATGRPSFGPQAAVSLLQAPLVNITTEGKDLNLRPEQVPPGQFRIRCSFSHTLPDDPIIFPNKPGASHLHAFFGSKVTDANSVDATKLVGTESTCFLRADAAAYWFPILYQRRPTKEANGRFLYDKIMPIWNLFYYRTGIGKVEEVKPFPPGLTMMAGDPKAGNKKAFSGPSVEWWCGTFGKHFSNFPSQACKGNSALIAKLNFPWCWNGKDISSPTGQGHVVYGKLNGTCPTGYTPVPRISLKVYYPVRQGLNLKWPSKGRAADPPVYLSTFDTGGTGSGFEFHADFMNGWDPAVLEELVRECINKNQKCRVISDVPIPPNPFDDGPSCGGKAC